LTRDCRAAFSRRRLCAECAVAICEKGKTSVIQASIFAIQHHLRQVHGGRFTSGKRPVHGSSPRDQSQIRPAERSIARGYHPPSHSANHSLQINPAPRLASSGEARKERVRAGPSRSSRCSSSNRCVKNSAGGFKISQSSAARSKLGADQPRAASARVDKPAGHTHAAG